MCQLHYGRQWKNGDPGPAQPTKNVRFRGRGLTPSDAHRLRTYGLTPSQYRRMLEVQNYACAVCGSEEPLQVDHDHDSGAVRALLCGACNRALGLLKEDPARIAGLAFYIGRFAAADASKGREYNR